MTAIRTELVHLAVADANSEAVEDILSVRPEFRTDGAGVFRCGQIVIHGVAESYEYGYARTPQHYCGELVVGAIVLDPVNSEDFVVAGRLEEGSRYGVIVNRRELRSIAETREALRAFCAEKSECLLRPTNK